jgi:hypothetical protein
MKHATLALGLAAALLADPVGALAQHEHSDMQIASTADGGGDLAIEYNFDAVVRTDFAGVVGPFALYSSSNPGFTALADEPLESLYELDAGSTIDMTVVTIDPSLQLQLGASVLDSANDSAEIGTHDVPGEDGGLHQHPTFRLLLDAPEGDFGEGTVSFKITGDPGNATSYGESEVYTLHVSNGYLPENANPAAIDGARCQKAVANEVRVFVGKQYKAMAGCLDLIQDFKAKGGDLGTPSNSVLGKCSTDSVKGLLAKIAADRAKALAKASGKCAGTFETVAISSHLGMAQCRTQELLGGAYASALEDLAVVMFGDDEAAAEAALPCLKETQGETVDLD